MMRQRGRELWARDMPDDYLYSTTALAAGLGIGRNAVRGLGIPVALEYKGQRFYRHCDVHRWIERDAANPTGSRLVALRAMHDAGQQRRFPLHRS